MKSISGFISSFNPILKVCNKHKIQLLFIGVALFCTILSLIILIYLNTNSDQVDSPIIENSSSRQPNNNKILVEIAGAINKPNVYELTYGSRIIDIIKMSGGLSSDASTEYFNRNFNLARLLSDQEKIYVPSQTEISSNVFIENQRTLDYSSPAVVPLSGTKEVPPTTSNTTKTNINLATLDELDLLPGIGVVTAQKIVQGRPYQSIDDLLTKKIVKTNIFENIKELIML
ncbi:MAG: helix-hairpin-helix domain-containing protein [bacterium]|nr:helix-hairpin-helix domain-containing protein [bacterium]